MTGRLAHPPRTGLREWCHADQNCLADQARRITVDRLSRLHPEHRVERLHLVDRLCRLDPVDRVRGLDPLGRIGRLSGLRFLDRLGSEHDLRALGVFPLVDTLQAVQ